MSSTQTGKTLQTSIERFSNLIYQLRDRFWKPPDLLIIIKVKLNLAKGRKFEVHVGKFRFGKLQLSLKRGA